LLLAYCCWLKAKGYISEWILILKRIFFGQDQQDLSGFYFIIFGFLLVRHSYFLKATAGRNRKYPIRFQRKNNMGKIN
jgi:hypothetical protein